MTDAPKRREILVLTPDGSAVRREIHPDNDADRLIAQGVAFEIEDLPPDLVFHENAHGPVPPLDDEET